MKKLTLMRRLKVASVLGTLAGTVAAMSMGACCIFIVHQPEVPKKLLKA